MFDRRRNTNVTSHSSLPSTIRRQMSFRSLQESAQPYDSVRRSLVGVVRNLRTCAQRGCNAPAAATVGVQTRSGERRFALCQLHYKDATTPCGVDGCEMLGEYVIELSVHTLDDVERTEEVRFCAEHWQQVQAAVAEHGPRRASPARGLA
jgi:hypothetical protein